MLVPVLRDVAHAQQRPLADGGVGDVLPAEGDLAGHQGLQSRQAVDQLRLAVAVDAGDTDDLSRPDRKGDILDGVVVVELGGHRHALHHQNGILGLGRLLVDHEFHVPAHHHAGELLPAGVRDVHRADVLAFPQDRAAVRHGHDLVELVGDEQDGLALCRQILHDLHQLVDLLGCQHGCRLVKNQDLVVPVQHLQDLRPLLHAHGDILHQSVRVHLQAVLLRQGQDLFPGLLLLQEAVAAGLHAQDDVVQDREALHQLEVLVDHADPQGVGVVGVLDLHHLAVLFDGALLRLVQAEEHAHERGLARAVLSQQGVDLSPLQLERDVVVGDDPWKAFGDVEHLDRIWLFQDYRPPLLCVVSLLYYIHGNISTKKYRQPRFLL